MCKEYDYLTKSILKMNGFDINSVRFERYSLMIAESFEEVVSNEALYTLEFDKLLIIIRFYSKYANTNNYVDIESLLLFIKNLSENVQYSMHLNEFVHEIDIKINQSKEDASKISSAIEGFSLKYLFNLQIHPSSLGKSVIVSIIASTPTTELFSIKIPKGNKFKSDCAGISLQESISMSRSIPKDGKCLIERVENLNSSDKTPLYVSISDEENQKQKIIVGEHAKSTSDIHPDKTIYGLQHIIGKKISDPDLKAFSEEAKFSLTGNENGDPIIRISGKKETDYSPDTLLSHIFRYQNDSFENKVGEKIDKLVITVPDNFTNEQMNAIEFSAQNAGINSVIAIPESIAASYQYHEDYYRYLCLFIYFGEELRISLVQIVKGNNFKLIQTRRYPSISNKKIVKALFNDIIAKLSSTPQDNDSFKITLMKNCFNACNDLNSNVSTYIRGIPNCDDKCINQACLDSLISDIIYKIITISRCFLKSLNVDENDYVKIIFQPADHVYYRAIVNELHETFNQDPIICNDLSGPACLICNSVFN